MPKRAQRTYRVMEIATATGGMLVVAFWALYFTANEALGLVDASVADFEEAFVVADAVFVAVLMMSSVALHRRSPASAFLLAIAGSMSVYLGLLDATFYLRHGLLSPLTGAAATELGIITLCIAGGLYALRCSWELWR